MLRMYMLAVNEQLMLHVYMLAVIHNQITNLAERALLVLLNIQPFTDVGICRDWDAHCMSG